MNKELALRTFAYLNRHYKTHNATIINKQEIEAIEFILNDNEFLEQQLHEASLTIQEMIEQDIECPSNCDKLKELRKQYCERTDCSGRIGNSKKVEELQQENKKQKELIDKAIDKLEKYAIAMINNGNAYAICVDLLDILKEVG